MTPAGTSNELDVQNGWEENTHTQVCDVVAKIKFARYRPESFLYMFRIARPVPVLNMYDLETVLRYMVFPTALTFWLRTKHL